MAPKAFLKIRGFLWTNFSNVLGLLFMLLTAYCMLKIGQVERRKANKRTQLLIAEMMMYTQCLAKVFRALILEPSPQSEVFLLSNQTLL